MKQFYLIGLMGICVVTFAQAPKTKVPTNVQNAAATAEKTRDVIPQSPVRVNPDQASNKETYFGKNTRSQLVGRSMNDQQTNASIYNRVHVFNDGKISVTWTTSADAAPYNSRGSGYNHFNGSAWGAVGNTRIEAERAGFPNYAYSASSNEEIIMSHRVKQGTGEAGGLFMNRKTGLGAGTWTSNLVLDTNIAFPGVLWPKTAVSGDYMHVFASYTDSSQNQPNRVIINGVRTPQVYSRYRFSTQTWINRNIMLPGYDATRYYSGGGDNYSIDVKDSTVVILIGGLTDDVTLFKSLDNGATWTKTIIDSFPVPAYDYNTTFDTAFSNDGAVHVILDGSGKAHCFWPIARVLDANATDGSVTYFPGQTQLRYWQEGWNIDSTKTIASMMDMDNDGSITLGSDWNNTGARYGNHSIVTMPSAGLSADGKIYVIYSALTEKDETTTGSNYRDVYGIVSYDGGNTWSDEVNLTAWIGLNIEQVFGSIARVVNNKVHVTFMQKNSVGRYDATNNPNAVGPYDIYYMSLDTAVFSTVDPVGLQNAKNNVFNVNQNYPNPFRTQTSIPVMMKQSAEVSVIIRNVVGQEVYNKNFGTQPSGNNVLDINAPGLQSGVYFYEVSAGGFSSTGKMIVE